MYAYIRWKLEWCCCK